jgi:hypothetical protein
MLPFILAAVGGYLIGEGTKDKQILEEGGMMAKGGMQGYDDKEDERLAMEHGKIAKKDFVGTHKQKEHSRRDDAKFEKRK